MNRDRSPSRGAATRTAQSVNGLLARALAGVAGALRAVGRLIRTVWRLAEALDSALWRGFKLSMRWLYRLGRDSLVAAADAFADVFRWLPSRSGRAYSAASGVFLAIATLWIIDEMRNAAPSLTNFDLLRPPIDEDDPIVARVDGRYVHLSEVEADARASGQLRVDDALTVETAFGREFVKAYVEQRLLARAAISDGVQRDPMVTRRLTAARDRILAAAYMEERIAAATTPDRIRRLYESQADIARLGDEIHARQIVVATESEARAILADLAAGADFGELARALSLDRPSARLGGDIGWFSKPLMTAAIADAAFATPVGEYAPLVYTDRGWHVLEIIGRRPGRGVSFTAIKDDIKEFLTLKAVEQAVADLAEEEDVIYYRPQPDTPRS